MGVMREDALRHDILRRFFAYWSRLRGDRIAPARRDIDPVEFGYALADLALIDVLRDDAGRLGFRYRLVGENIVRRDGYSMRGKLLDELPETEYRERIRRSWTEVVESGEPAHVIREAVFDGRARNYESLVLPLSSDGERVDMLIGLQRYLDPTS
jgi:hypothetical protein